VVASVGRDHGLLPSSRSGIRYRDSSVYATTAARRAAKGSPYEHEGRSHTLRTENWAAAVVDRLAFNAHIINTGTAPAATHATLIATATE
jgi:hypothetical protein